MLGNGGSNPDRLNNVERVWIESVADAKVTIDVDASCNIASDFFLRSKHFVPIILRSFLLWLSGAFPRSHVRLVLRDSMVLVF